MSDEPRTFTEREALVGTSSALTILFARLVDELARAGVMSKADFAGKIRDMADAAEAKRDRGKPTFDLLLIRQVADNLQDAGPPKGWTPEIIIGGKDD
jgi:hypothetical protein